jgi:hypothetical protein
MKFIFFVLLPLCLQLLIGAAVMFSNKPGGEFVGLGVMLLGMFAVPATAIINWHHTRAQPPLTLSQQINRTFYISLIFPALSIALYVLAS